MAERPFAAGGEDSGNEQRWRENNSKNKKLCSRNPHYKSQNPSYIPHPQQQSSQTTTTTDGSNSSQKPQHHFDTVASYNSSSGNHLQTASQNPSKGDSLPGYVNFDNKVIVSLNSRSKLEIRELKRKLVSELHQVRSLKKRLEAKEAQYNWYNDNEIGSGSNRVSTLARVNSEVSYVGPANPKPIGDTNVSVDNNGDRRDQSSVGEHVDREKRTPKANQNHRKSDSVMQKEKFSNSEGNKKLKPSGGGKGVGDGEVIGFEPRVDRELLKKCRDLLGMLMKHQYGWVFNTPVNVKKLKLQDYYDIIKHPMDLGTVKSRLSKNWYKSPKEFAEDVRLTFNNAMTYNEKGQDVHYMANMMLNVFEEKWRSINAQFNVDDGVEIGYDARLPTPTSKRGPAPHASACASALTPPSPSLPLYSRILDRSEPMPMPADSNMKAGNVATNQDRIPVSKKPKAKDPQKREMTYAEKQRLSIDLQILPSEKLESVVQIIRKRNPGLFQQEDEIEVDIESFDNETLWELDKFVTYCKKSLNKNQKKSEVALQAREVSGCNIQEAVPNQTSATAETTKEPVAVEKIVNTSPVRREKQSDNMSGSSSSSSSSGESRSSSSESDSDSSSGDGSDVGQ